MLGVLLASLALAVGLTGLWNVDLFEVVLATALDLIPLFDIIPQPSETTVTVSTRFLQQLRCASLNRGSST